MDKSFHRRLPRKIYNKSTWQQMMKTIVRAFLNFWIGFAFVFKGWSVNLPKYTKDHRTFQLGGKTLKLALKCFP